MGQCPTVSIDKTDGCQMYLSKESLNAEIVTAKSSEMNILVPKEDGDFVSTVELCISGHLCLGSHLSLAAGPKAPKLTFC